MSLVGTPTPLTTLFHKESDDCMAKRKHISIGVKRRLTNADYLLIGRRHRPGHNKKQSVVYGKALCAEQLRLATVLPTRMGNQFYLLVHIWHEKVATDTQSLSLPWLAESVIEAREAVEQLLAFLKDSGVLLLEAEVRLYLFDKEIGNAKTTTNDDG